MLTRHRPHSPRLHERQRGVVLVIALIVLVAMTLAGIALVRSVDTATIIAGNLAFQQAATQSGDGGVESAVAWLETNNNGVTLNTDSNSNGYIANGTATGQSPAAGQSWDDFWNKTLKAKAKSLDKDSNTGNTVRYVIQRMCSVPGSPSPADCFSPPPSGNKQGPNTPPLVAQIYYRITVRVDGPRNAVSYIQSIVAL